MICGAVLRNMTYESPFYIDIKHKYIEINEKTGKNLAGKED